MTTAFVLSGGGNLGAVQVGMLLALADRGIFADLLVGTSVGALNAAYVAADPSPAGVRRLADVWTSLRRRDVFPTRPTDAVRAVVGRRNSFIDPTGLRRLIERNVPFERLEDAPWPVSVVATEVTSGREVVLSRGPAVDAIMASAAIPAVFPPVTIEGHVLMDGGVVNQTPITVAAGLGADTIYVLPTGHACALERAPASALGMALHAVTTALQQRLVFDVLALQDSLALRVAPPLCPVSVAPTDFSHSAELIARARASTRSWLDSPTPADQSSYLQLHTHTAGAPSPREYERATTG